ncbi:hypothetical protein Phum_PHUM311470 [Pediculus humanus corporis]|uniref:Uncharacterized protein n=1 Tax=Pediculus humanus subsp. corporis TaxID=121224 RepID=E0VMK6_PEDHC|nr:uncharacterized protein Phum_PHUM311470 [Pediculus humanus corporis]EEB14612.1 hypothetical protein Phum_PHUM311470 [Pediculus humanus corporis]
MVSLINQNKFCRYCNGHLLGIERILPGSAKAIGGGTTPKHQTASVYRKGKVVYSSDTGNSALSSGKIILLSDNPYKFLFPEEEEERKVLILGRFSGLC